MDRAGEGGGVLAAFELVEGEREHLVGRELALLDEGGDVGGGGRAAGARLGDRAGDELGLLIARGQERRRDAEAHDADHTRSHAGMYRRTLVEDAKGAGGQRRNPKGCSMSE